MFSPNGFIIFVTMKRMILLLICAICAASCNPSVFIEPLVVESSGTEFDVPFTGGSVLVNVSHGDWEVQNVTIDHVDAWWISEDSMRHESNFMSFEITRPQSSCLVFTLDESVNSDSSLIQIFIGNDYESDVVSINIGACGGYSFDRVEYGVPVVLSDDDAYELVWSRTVNNGSGQHMDWECSVFDENFCRTIWFPASTVLSDDMPYVMWYDTLMKFVVESFDVPVPAPLLSDGYLSLSDEKIEFSYDKVVQPIEFMQSNVAVTLAPGDNAVRMYWGYQEYEVPYTMWFKHSGNGRDHCFTGMFTSKAYNGKWRVEL